MNYKKINQKNYFIHDDCIDKKSNYISSELKKKTPPTIKSAGFLLTKPINNYCTISF